MNQNQRKIFSCQTFWTALHRNPNIDIIKDRTQITQINEDKYRLKTNK